ncbi:MAG TPA: ferrous iron transport protein A [Methanothermococcus okinawensis]|uniref:Ferrous iron transport protein A n=1 Tax=Methanothermococcus okinawensis TaxID=155863 RepID=A0A832ZII4_9EURY|nr:ferrous iron transport protein A [Methanococcaceae archaeon]HIP84445.1 ferrous iron transport protein A [Methanothermococcus okinawensis]HIP91127.1 ferrous iron transport protein A [Methanothermococcus okinawensis]
MESLADKKPGIYVIKEIVGKYKKLYDLGILAGRRITVISNDRGPMIVKVNNSKIAMGKDIGRCIVVE